jgi:DNA-binding response OmpR family regulator
MPETVLLVEDNKQLNDINRRALERKGYEVLTAMTLADARHHMEKAAARVDVILLDIAMPDGNGIDFCSEIRSSTMAHILFLTSEQEYDSMIKSLNVGGDDYITKPYKLEEMLTRVDVAMRRRKMDAAKSVQVITSGTLTLDPIGPHAILDGVDMQLTGKEFIILYLLVKNKGNSVSGEELYAKAWKQPMAGDVHALKNVVYRLRAKLQTGHSGFHIVSSRGEGYSFEANE